MLSVAVSGGLKSLKTRHTTARREAPAILVKPGLGRLRAPVPSPHLPGPRSSDLLHPTLAYTALLLHYFGVTTFKLICALAPALLMTSCSFPRKRFP